MLEIVKEFCSSPIMPTKVQQGVRLTIILLHVYGSASRIFTENPVSQQVRIGSKLALRCSVNQSVDYLIWTVDRREILKIVNNTNLAADDRIRGFRNGETFTLEISPVTEIDGGYYRCKVSSNDTDMKESGSARVHCRTPANDPICWYKPLKLYSALIECNSTVHGDNLTLKMDNGNTGNTSFILNRHSLNITYNVTFLCTADNIYINSRSYSIQFTSINVNIEYSIVEEPPSQICEGDSIKYICNGISYPEVTAYYWTLNGHQLNASNISYVIEDDGKIIHIHVLKLEHLGVKIECTAHNGFDTMNTSRIICFKPIDYNKNFSKICSVSPEISSSMPTTAPTDVRWPIPVATILVPVILSTMVVIVIYCKFFRNSQSSSFRSYSLTKTTSTGTDKDEPMKSDVSSECFADGDENTGCNETNDVLERLADDENHENIIDASSGSKVNTSTLSQELAIGNCDDIVYADLDLETQTSVFLVDGQTAEYQTHYATIKIK